MLKKEVIPLIFESNKNKYDKMFMDIALLTAKQSNCIKYQVGCVLVRNNRIILQGYNGTVTGFVNCNEKFREIDLNVSKNRKKHFDWSNAVELHAEMNIITYAAKHGIIINNSILYCTHKPCNNCLKHLVSAGIKKVIYYHDYIDNIQIKDIEQFYKLIELIDYKALYNIK